jgi:Protein of unknown function (DUF3237)
MLYSCQGLTLLYDLPDVPAPQGDQPWDKGVSFTVMLKPANISNAVTVSYSVDGGPTQQLHAVAGKSDYRQNAQYFAVAFPKLSVGQRVDYAVSGSCAGRQVPEWTSVRNFAHSFRVIDLTKNKSFEPRVSGPMTPALIDEPGRYELTGEFLARFTIKIQSPRTIGPTPDGIRTIWNAVSGTVVGPRLNAKVLQGADWMQIRPDGVANIDVRAALETNDGARIMSIYTGVMEMGEDGYKNFLANKLPSTFQARTSQRFLTGDPKYKWLTRLQCVSVGTVFLGELAYVYDVYALR